MDGDAGDPHSSSFSPFSVDSGHPIGTSAELQASLFCSFAFNLGDLIFLNCVFGGDVMNLVHEELGYHFGENLVPRTVSGMEGDNPCGSRLLSGGPNLLFFSFLPDCSALCWFLLSTSLSPSVGDSNRWVLTPLRSLGGGPFKSLAS